MHNLLLISEDESTISLVGEILGDGYSVIAVGRIEEAINHIYDSFPDLIMLDLNVKDKKAITGLNTLKGDPIFYQLPILVIMDEETHSFDWKNMRVDDYLKKRDIATDLKNRVDLCIARSKRTFEVNPLTRLPGNISITREIQRRLDTGKIFALAYLDIDNFKPYNDYYGFGRGDDVIRMTGRLIMNIVRSLEESGSFVGHIGGDDFVYIMSLEKIEPATKEIIDKFGEIIPAFYEEEDRQRGYIESVDRSGVRRKYSLMTLSIGIAHNRYRAFTHHGEMSGVASEMKKQAKKINVSAYLIDRRRK